jgi:hypothetical protein
MALIVPKVVDDDAEKFIWLCVAIGICISDQQIGIAATGSGASGKLGIAA